MYNTTTYEFSDASKAVLTKALTDACDTIMNSLKDDAITSDVAKANMANGDLTMAAAITTAEEMISMMIANFLLAFMHSSPMALVKAIGYINQYKYREIIESGKVN